MGLSYTYNKAVLISLKLLRIVIRSFSVNPIAWGLDLPEKNRISLLAFAKRWVAGNAKKAFIASIGLVSNS
jgi:hypothetical protein